MRVLIALAFKVRPETVKGPGCMESERFDIVAKAEQPGSPDDLRVMVQNLLAERFKLAVHSEDKESRAYVLVKAKSGPTLKRSESAAVTEQRCIPSDGAPEQRHFVCGHMTMALFAATLQEIAAREIDVPVVDQTDLKGAFDFRLDWVPRPPNAQPEDALGGPTLFEAVENQLGLKLETRKVPLPVIVVDNLERAPAQN